MSGIAVVLVLLLFAAQVTFDLYARSAVTSAAVDAARSVSDHGLPVDGAVVARAESRARSALGAYGAVTSFIWRLPPNTPAPDEVDLRVMFDLRRSRYNLAGPLVLPALATFDRTVEVRVEHIVCPEGRRCAIVSPGP